MINPYVGYPKMKPIILEPVMSVHIVAPSEFQTNVMSQVNKRKGVINDSDVVDGYVTVQADIPLNKMFGYISDLRSGK
jgi:elongation factor G